MIYLLWAAIILQGCVTVWLAWALAASGEAHTAQSRFNAAQCDVNTSVNKFLNAQVGINDYAATIRERVSAKLRALGQPLD